MDYFVMPIRQLLNLVFSIVLLSAPSVAQAGEVLFVSPTRVTLSEQNRVAVVNISNLSDVSRTYDIKTTDIVMGKNGTTSEVDNFDYSAKRIIRFVPRRFTIDPGKRQTVRIMTRMRSDIPDGDYHVHLNFEEDPKMQGIGEDGTPNHQNGTAGMSAPLAYSTLIPVIVSHGDVSSKISMDAPKLSPAKDKVNTYNLHLTLHRSGNGQGTAVFKFEYLDPSGKTYPLGKKSTAYIYREINTRSYTRPITLPDDVAKGGELVIQMYDANSDLATPLQTLKIKM